MNGYWEDFERHDDNEPWAKVGEGQNLIVNLAYVAMAALFKGDATNGKPILYWAVGDGNTTDTAGWDAGLLTLPAVAPAKTDTALLRETYRQSIAAADMVYVDNARVFSATPTNSIKITMLLGNTEPSGSVTFNLREWGLYAGNASGTAGTGWLVNHKFHATYAKLVGVQLLRTLYLTF